MNIEYYKDKIDSYIDGIRNQRDFKHLHISIECYETDSAKDRINIESNAYIGIRNSLSADTMITNYIINLFKDYEGEKKYIFKIIYN